MAAGDWVPTNNKRGHMGLCHSQRPPAYSKCSKQAVEKIVWVHLKKKKPYHRGGVDVYPVKCDNGKTVGLTSSMYKSISSCCITAYKLRITTHADGTHSGIIMDRTVDFSG